MLPLKCTALVRQFATYWRLSSEERTSHYFCASKVLRINVKRRDFSYLNVTLHTCVSICASPHIWLRVKGHLSLRWLRIRNKMRIAQSQLPCNTGITGTIILSLPQRQFFPQQITVKKHTAMCVMQQAYLRP